MTTKFDIGDEVLVKAKVEEIKITRSGAIQYVLYNKDWTNREVFKEEDIVEQLKEQNK